jgi:hypothetical protein
MVEDLKCSNCGRKIKRIPGKTGNYMHAEPVRGQICWTPAPPALPDPELEAFLAAERVA